MIPGLEKERESERETYRQTDRQIDRKTDTYKKRTKIYLART